MTCPSCGSEVRDPQARFCPSCGAPLQVQEGPFHGERVDLPDPRVTGVGQSRSGLRYKLIGTTLPAVVLELGPGHQVYSESGGMAWMSANVRMETRTGGGLGKMLGRVLSGESLFIVEYSLGSGDRGLVAFASEFPGKIVPLELAEGQSVIVQKDAFMCAEASVELKLHFRKRLAAGLFGGEGFILQEVTGPGLAFFEFDGEVVEYTLSDRQVLKVDTGHVAMFEPSVDFDVEMMRGFKNIFFGGEGLFLATLRGPGRVWLQTMPIANLARKLRRYMPAGSGGGKGFSINLGGD